MKIINSFLLLFLILACKKQSIEKIVFDTPKYVTRFRGFYNDKTLQVDARIQYNENWQPIEIVIYDSKITIEYKNNKPVFLKNINVEGQFETEITWNTSKKITLKKRRIDKTGIVTNWSNLGEINLDKNDLISSFKNDDDDRLIKYDNTGNIIQIVSKINNDYDYQFSNFDKKFNPFSTNYQTWLLFSLTGTINFLENTNLNNPSILNMKFGETLNYKVTYIDYTFDAQNYLTNITKIQVANNNNQISEEKITYIYDYLEGK